MGLGARAKREGALERRGEEIIEGEEKERGREEQGEERVMREQRRRGGTAESFKF